MNFKADQNWMLKKLWKNGKNVVFELISIDKSDFNDAIKLIDLESLKSLAVIA